MNSSALKSRDHGLEITTLAALIPIHQTGSVGEGNDHLQLIKFWPSCAPGKGVCGGAEIFGSTLLQPERSVCVSLSAFFIVVLFLKPVNFDRQCSGKLILRR